MDYFDIVFQIHMHCLYLEQDNELIKVVHYNVLV
jgi:hypothetical protein